MHIREVLGKPVVSSDTGERAGRVADVLLDVSRRQVVGLLITDGMLSKQQVLPYGDVQTVGVDTIIARTLATLREAGEWKREGLAADRSNTVHGKAVVTAAGAHLGTVHDLVADERTGHVTAIEVSTGGSGPPSLVHAAEDICLSNEVVVVPGEVAGTRETT